MIRVVAGVLIESIRGTDIGGRYGGEEFGVILPATSAADGHVVAERIRTRIENTPVTHEQQTIAFTVSLGIADFSQEMAGHAEWLSHADQALYQAKEGGRNRTVIWK